MKQFFPVLAIMAGLGSSISFALPAPVAICSRLSVCASCRNQGDLRARVFRGIVLKGSGFNRGTALIWALKGRGFSRAAYGPQNDWALAPEGWF